MSTGVKSLERPLHGFGFVLAVTLLLTSAAALAQSPSLPLSRAEILGQLAVGKFPSYVAYQIKTRGIGFTPDSDYLRTIEKAGGEGVLLDRLSKASAANSSLEPSPIDQPYYRLAQCAAWLHLGATNRAKADCRAAVNENPTSVFPVLAALMTLDDSDDLQERLRLSRRAVVLAPDELMAHSFLVDSIRRSMTQDGDSRELFEETQRATEVTTHDLWSRVSFLPGRAMSDGPYVAPPSNPPSDVLRALQLEPDFAPAHFRMAYYFEGKSESEKVWSELREAIRLEPGNADLHFAAGDVYARYEKYEEAATEYREAARISPYNWVYHEQLVLTLFGSHRVAEAIEEIKQGLHWVPTNSNLSNDLVQQYIEAEDFKSAVAETRRFLDACKGQNQNEDCKLFAGQAIERLPWLLHRNGEWISSANLYKELLISAPGSAGLRSTYADLLADQGSLSSAEAHFREAIRIEPGSVSAHLRLGALLIREKRFDDGIAEYEEALRLQPEGTEVLIPLGIARARKGDLDIAIQLFREAVNRDEDNAYAHTNLAWALSLKKENASAVVEVRRALELDPELRTAHNQLAWLLATAPHLRDPNGALEHAQMAVKLLDAPPTATQTERAIFLDTLAEALLINRKPNEALETEQKAVASDPQNSQFKARLPRFQQAVLSTGAR